MLVKIKQKYLEDLTHHIREHSIIKLALRGEGIPSKSEHTQTGGREIMSLQIFASHINFFKKVTCP